MKIGGVYFPYEPTVEKRPEINQGRVLVIFLHGSEDEFQTEVFQPGLVVGQTTTPLVIGNLHRTTAKGKPIVVFSHQSFVEPIPGLSEGDVISGPETKAVRRFTELGGLLEYFEHIGYRKENIFISGHSAGAWVALWLISLYPNRCAGVIGFAPAFSGQHDRHETWEALRGSSINDILAAKEIPSLVYTFNGDEFEQPDEIKRIFRKGSVVKQRCDRVSMFPGFEPMFHCGAYHPDFERREKSRILSFISNRLSS